MTSRSAFVLLAALATAACGDEDDRGAESTGAAGSGGAAAGDAGSDTAAPPEHTSEIYSDPASWLCLPGAATDYCLENLDATALLADGTERFEPHEVIDDPAVDCFYVYPTISTDPTPNSDLIPGPEEINIVQGQAARLTSVCAVYAPIYRQNTLASLFGVVQSEVTPAERREIAYSDALDAWKHYLAHYNPRRDRGYVLIGHSQGAGILSRLIREEIEGDPELVSHLVSAFLLGSSVAVPEGRDVGGDFATLPLCRDPSETGCIVSYATFRKTAPPPPTSFFGKPRSGAGVAACNNPAALSGGPAMLTPYFRTADVDGVDVPTRFVTFPDFLEGECVFKNDFSYLELTVHGDPADPRPDDIGGDLGPSWGLHLVDAHIAMGDIVELAKSQIAAYEAR